MASDGSRLAPQRRSSEAVTCKVALTGGVPASRKSLFRRSWRISYAALPFRARGESLSAVVKSFTSDTGSALSESAGLLLASESYEELLQSAAELSVRTIAGVTISGITLSQDGHVLTVASADELADRRPCFRAPRAMISVCGAGATSLTLLHHKQRSCTDLAARASLPSCPDVRGLGARILLDRSTDPVEPLKVCADPAGHPFCLFAAGSPPRQDA